MLIVIAAIALVATLYVSLYRTSAEEEYLGELQMEYDAEQENFG